MCLAFSTDCLANFASLSGAFPDSRNRYLPSDTGYGVSTPKGQLIVQRLQIVHSNIALDISMRFSSLSSTVLKSFGATFPPAV